jgi:hypothetical protein
MGLDDVMPHGWSGRTLHQHLSCRFVDWCEPEYPTRASGARWQLLFRPVRIGALLPRAWPPTRISRATQQERCSRSFGILDGSSGQLRTASPR